MEIEFIRQNWYLFVALVGIVGLIALEPLRQKMSGVKRLSILQYMRLASDENPQLIDVSEAKEYKKGHIPSSKNVPLSGLDDALPKLGKFKNKPVVITCQTGTRSNRAASKLTRQEFSQVYILEGGLAAWEKENMPVER
ncbi:MAG TPA: rhodanese-like domain-containing protein [Gammaproteobacteria bacterium]|nr:rhodanese-like domain-containing protein [Gammaproteobacteria bacterium]